MDELCASELAPQECAIRIGPTEVNVSDRYPKDCLGTNMIGVILPQEPGVALEPYQLDDPDEPLTISQRLSATPPKRKEKKRYEPDPYIFQKKKKGNRKGKEKEHTPILDEQEEEDEELPIWNDITAMKSYADKQQLSSQFLGNPQHSSMPRTPYTTGRGRKPNSTVTVGSRLTEHEDIILVSLALKYQASYGLETMQVFWKRVRNKFERITKRTYASVERRTKDLLEMRQEQLKKESKAGHGHEARDDVWTQAIDDWNEVVTTLQKKKHTSRAAKAKKIQDSKDHDRKRESLNERLGNKKKKVTIDISSNETTSDETNSQDDETNNETDNESSTDIIPDDLATYPTTKSV